MANFNEKDIVVFKIEGGKIIDKFTYKHRTLKSRIAKYKGDYMPNEWNIGISVRKEV